jgi:hypothetical protein
MNRALLRSLFNDLRFGSVAALGERPETNQNGQFHLAEPVQMCEVSSLRQSE